MIVMNGLKKIGSVRAYAATEITRSYLGIGFEKLDRAVFDPEKAYGPLAALGVKKVRLQSGWQRTERVKGIYDFAWLDSIVDQLILRGMEPWMCLCYGNDLYTESAREVFGAVGCPPIKTEEERAAWRAYVTALTAHFQGRVHWYEIWNEPDGPWCWKSGVNGTEYGEFVKETAGAVRAGDGGAEVMANFCGLRGWSMKWLCDVLETGAGQTIDALSYHAYTVDETTVPFSIRGVRALLAQYGLPNLPLIQGETGCPSRDDGFGALHFCAWTEKKQAKVLLRSTFLHLGEGVLFTSYFSTMDMIEALNGTNSDKKTYLDYGYFGVLSADFDENGVATGEYRPKPSYHALQTAAAFLREEPERCQLPVMFGGFENAVSPRLDRACDPVERQLSFGFKRPNGSAAFVYYHPSEVLTTDYDSVTQLTTSLPGEIRVVDLMDGSIYLPDPKTIREQGRVRILECLPLRDYPLAVTFGDFL